MSVTAEVAAPLVDVRDVPETFRRHQILIEDWAIVLSNAARSLDQASTGVVANGLPASTEIVDRVADETQRILSQTRIPGIPRPEDEHWEFT